MEDAAMADSLEKADAEQVREYWQGCAEQALQQAERTADPSMRAYLKSLAQDFLQEATRTAQTERH
jgi:16S rRNA U1498 N3-methylase RsmE